jgi:hypothetical protein
LVVPVQPQSIAGSKHASVDLWQWKPSTTPQYPALGEQNPPEPQSESTWQLAGTQTFG